jgi:tetratricopeptide (TPR) repeat protein
MPSDNVIEPKAATDEAYRSGQDHFASGDYDQAITSFTEAIHLDSNNAKAYLGRARTFEAKGDKSRARADRDAAVRILNPINRSGLPIPGSQHRGLAARAVLWLLPKVLVVVIGWILLVVTIIGFGWCVLSGPA